jgi:hypothetical protein
MFGFKESKKCLYEAKNIFTFEIQHGYHKNQNFVADFEQKSATKNYIVEAEQRLLPRSHGSFHELSTLYVSHRRFRICKHLRSPGIDSEESIPRNRFRQPM